MTATAWRWRRPAMYPKQEAAFFGEERYAITEATTKSGKTVGGMAWITEQAVTVGQPGRNFWWIAPIISQSKIAFRRLKLALPQSVYEPNETERTITLANHAVIWFKGADDPDGLYGEDVYAAVMDEVTRCKEESWFAVRTTLTATRGPIRFIGNVKGKRNWAYKLARMAEAGAPNWTYHRITAQDAIDAGVIDAAEVEDARQNLPEHVFRELYEAIASDDGGNPFGHEAIHNQVRPLSEREPICFGIDLAKSVDWTVITGLDARGDTCRWVRFQKPWKETMQEIRRVIGAKPALIDSTGVGDPIVEQLQRSPGVGHVQGYQFTQPSKQRLMEGLAVAIQQGTVGYPDGTIVAELEQFEYEYTRTGVRYASPEGLHDDCVMSLALAVALHRQYASDPSGIYGVVTCGGCGHMFYGADLERPCPKCNSKLRKEREFSMAID
ncbi:MAG: hypothetical protein ACRENL_02795 [Candidatus Dormibacteria bacterium]